MFVARLIAGAALLFSCAASAHTIHSFSQANGVATCGIGIAHDRTVVGDNPSGTGTPGAFVYHKRAFSFPVPAVPAGMVVLTGINRSHTIAGFDLITGADLAISFVSFTLSNGTTTLLALPGAVSVQAIGINDAGTIVGGYQTSATGPTLGFVDKSGRVTTLDDGIGDTLPTAIDPSGKIVVGDAIDAGLITGWIHEHGAFATIAIPGAAGTLVNGVTASGEVSGTYVTSAQALGVETRGLRAIVGRTGLHGIVSGSPSHGFFYQAGVYTTFDVPGATSTQLGGINSEGDVTGCYTDATGVHGMIVTP